jgi:hypothetical protein
MRHVFRCAAAALLLGLAGCGDGPARSVVTGRVTYKGQPVAKGQIRFLIAGQPTAMGQIENGAYRIDHLGGVPVGSGKVEIEGFEDTGRVVFTGPTGQKVFEAKQILPDKYNTKTELTVEIKQGTNEKNFDLQP